jgi:flagellar biosynthesis/type III secretory pathway protein FliH
LKERKKREEGGKEKRKERRKEGGKEGRKKGRKEGRESIPALHYNTVLYIYKSGLVNTFLFKILLNFYI